VILGLVIVPLTIALVVLILRDVPLISAPLTAVTLIAVAVLALTRKYTASLLFFGRTLSLAPLEAQSLAFCAILLAMMVVYASRIAHGSLTYALTLGAMGLFAGATMMGNNAIAGLLLEMGAFAAIMLIPSRQEGAAMTGMRALMLLALGGAVILLSAWAIESRAVNPDAAFLGQLASLALVIGFGLALGVAPFHAWLPPVFRYGSPIATVLLSVVLGIVALLRLNDTMQTAMWPGGQELFANLLLAGGALTCIAGSLMAIAQRAVNRALAYTALADMGIVLIGLGTGAQSSAVAATLHLIYRGLAIAAISMALGMLREYFGGDDLDRLNGAIRNAPVTILGIVIGGLSLGGLPLTAGFTTRLLIYRALAVEHASLAIVIMVCSFGPLWAFMRFLSAAITSAPSPGNRREAYLPSLLIVILIALLVVIGLYPAALNLLPTEWLDALRTGILSQP